jgi:hypothetical protein
MTADQADAQGFRRNFAMQRRQTADQNLNAAIDALGKTIQTYDTPEQKQAFGLTLDRLHESAQPNANPALALQSATAAGLADREADWRRQSLNAEDGSYAQLGLYVSLQQRRLQFRSLAHDLEAYAALLVKFRNPILTQAAQAYRDAGDTANEIRLTASQVRDGESLLRTRYFDLMLRRDPAGLTALAGSNNISLADAALNYTVAHGSEAQALAAVASRGKGLNPVWRPASASLVQTYFAPPASDPINLADFNQALAANSTIAARLAAPADPTHQLTGDAFFYYASRYGIFLKTINDPAQTLPDAENFLPAELEGSPAMPVRYLNLARTYAEAHNIDAAVAEYNHALELSPSDAAIEDEIATTLYRASRHDQALTHWHQALSILARMQQHAMYPESWFTSLETISRHLGEYHLTATLRPELETILGPYLAKNGNYRSNELLKSIYLASASPAEGANFIITAANSASDPNQILVDLDQEPWLAEDAREALLLREIELAREQPARDVRSSHQYQLVDIYLDQNQLAKAQTLLDSIPNKETNSNADIDSIILAVRTNHLQPLLDKWRANPDLVPAQFKLNSALFHLSTPTSAYKPIPLAIRPLQEFVFERKTQSHTLVPTDFLALAQLRLDTSDLPGALDLLHQLTLQHPANYENGAITFPVPGQPEFQSGQPASIDYSPSGETSNPYINTDYAAALLEKDHHPAEAIPFLQSLVNSVPWDASYRFRLAQAQLASNAHDLARTNFITVARDTSAPYDLRVQAARALAPLTTQATELGSPELSFIAHPGAIAAARQPYSAEARIAAAALSSTSTSDREHFLREAVAIAPAGPSADRARIDLFLLQPATVDPSASLAILGSLQNTAPNHQPASNDPNADNSDAADTTPDEATPFRGATIDSPDNAAVPPATVPAAFYSLDLATRIRVVTQLATANQRDGNLESAYAYAQLAVTLSNGSPQPELTRRRDDLKAAVLVARRNSLRRPNLHQALDQSIQVRPHLTAATVYQEESQ